VADKDEEGTAGEPTPVDPSTSSAGAHALGHPDSPRGDEVAEPTGDELAASGYDTAGRDDLADLEGPAPVAGRTEDDARDADVDRDADALEPVAAGTVGRELKPARERRPAPQAKGAPTPARNRPVKQHRTGPVGFVKESVGELRKVVYPTGQQLLNYFVVVLVFVLFVIAYVSLLDLGMGWAIFRVFS
jgi:preprotein translocase subunit SecE